MSQFNPNEKGFADLERALAFGLLNLGFAIEADAKGRCPYQTGNLRRSIHTAAFYRGQRIHGATDDNGRPTPDYAQAPRSLAMVAVGTNSGYGVFVELGTIHARAQPFLGPALADNRGRASEIVKAGMAAHLR